MEMGAPEVAELSLATESLAGQTEAEWFDRLPRIREDLNTFQQQLDAGASSVTANNAAG